VLDAVMPDNPTERFRADLEHRGCIFGGVNFQNVEIDSVRVLTWEYTMQPVRASRSSLCPNAEKLVIVACVALQLS
jgi:hypothetical protein